MASHVHLFTPAAAVTFTAQDAVKGGQLVAIAGDRAVVPAEAGTAKHIGAAAFDVPAGEKVTVLRGGVQRLLAAGTVTAGNAVIAGAAGTVADAGATPDALAVVGIALTGGTNVHVEIALSR